MSAGALAILGSLDAKNGFTVLPWHGHNARVSQPLRKSTSAQEVPDVAVHDEHTSASQSTLPSTLAPLLTAAVGGTLALRVSQRRVAKRGSKHQRGKALSRQVASIDVEAPSMEDQMVDEMAGLGKGGSFGGYTSSNVSARRIQPSEKQQQGRSKVKIVYVVLESQYQASMSAAVRQINSSKSQICAECVGYLLEELRDPDIIQDLKADLADANVFICSLIFVQELAEKLVEVIGPVRDRLDACLCFPSMPEVMKLNKLGTFDLTTITGGPLGGFAQQIKDMRQKTLKKGKPASGGAFQDSLLKLVRTLPKVLKFLPGDQARDARTFILSLQHWLGGTPENLEAMLMRIAGQYVSSIEAGSIELERIMEPVVLPDQGIWHPCSPTIFTSQPEYNEWYEKEHMPAAGVPADAPTIGVILQKSHIATKDDGHYVSFVQELEQRGAKVICSYTGGLDFSAPARDYLSNEYTGEGQVDVLVNLTGFSLVGGPASQDAKKSQRVPREVQPPIFG